MRFILTLLLVTTPYLFADPIGIVYYNTNKEPGSIIVDTSQKRLYFLVDYQLAYVYPIAVGKKRYQFFGNYTISRKAEWPTWRPTENTLADKPWLPNAVKGGANNPLGARALYLGDSDYRIHGTNNPSSIGKAASRGCIRMYNEDVIDLYSMVETGAKAYIQ